MRSLRCLKNKQEMQARLGPEKGHHARPEASGSGAPQNPTPSENSSQSYNNRNCITNTCWQACSERAQSWVICWLGCKTFRAPAWTWWFPSRERKSWTISEHLQTNAQPVTTQVSQPICTHQRTQSPMSDPHQIHPFHVMTGYTSLDSNFLSVDWHTKSMFKNDEISSVLAWKPRIVQKCAYTIQMTNLTASVS